MIREVDAVYTEQQCYTHSLWQNICIRHKEIKYEHQGRMRQAEPTSGLAFSLTQVLKSGLLGTLLSTPSMPEYNCTIFIVLILMNKSLR